MGPSVHLRQCGRHPGIWAALLAVERGASAGTQNQTLSALLFLYRVRITTDGGDLPKSRKLAYRNRSRIKITATDSRHTQHDLLLPG